MKTTIGPYFPKLPLAPPRWKPVKPVMLFVCYPATRLSVRMVNPLILKPSLAVHPRGCVSHVIGGFPNGRAYKDPVVKLVLALYGHPDAGGFWEQRCEKALCAVGFEQCPNWKSVFRHEKLNLMLVVYVDDFKLSGPKSNLSKGWQLIRSKIKMEDATPIKRYLGCEHVTFQYSVSGQFDPQRQRQQAVPTERKTAAPPEVPTPPPIPGFPNLVPPPPLPSGSQARGRSRPPEPGSASGTFRFG